MSHVGFAKTLHFKPVSFRYIFSFLLVIHIVAALSLLLPTTLSLFWRVLLCMGLILSVSIQYHQYHNTPHELTWNSPDQWRLVDAEGIAYEAILASGSVITNFFAALRFRYAHNRQTTVFILATKGRTHELRQLRVMLD